VVLHSRRDYAKSVERKLEALHAGDRRPQVVDLFSGCGGLFLGFQRAGCESLLGIEVDPLAAATFARNFHRGPTHDQHAEAKDITAARNRADQILLRFGCSHPESAVDFIVGGPPCPAFARVGRAKLRQVNGHPEAFKHDSRAKLYRQYLAFVSSTAPVALLMENVPDVLNFGGRNLAEEICEELESMGYRTAYTLLNAASYGVPQMRERFFLCAVHEAAASTPMFPLPTHRVDFPPGYASSRKVALKHLSTQRANRFVQTPVSLRLKEAVTAEEALADLPALTAHLTGDDRRGARRFDTLARYRSGVRPSAYATELRTWPGFGSTDGVVDHVTRCLSTRDYRLFARMNEGDEYPEAHALAERLFQEQQGGGKVRADFVPPYDPEKFPNKWRKLERDMPARTLMAHLGKDTYSHIHYDNAQARVISVREAARLQSFPDGFAFSGTMNPAFRQIGNSVPPLMAFALAKAIKQALRLTELLPSHCIASQAPLGAGAA
jgi:DNA (cytosine-5)-methyltransferase 1